MDSLFATVEHTMKSELKEYINKTFDNYEVYEQTFLALQRIPFVAALIQENRQLKNTLLTLSENMAELQQKMLYSVEGAGRGDDMDSLDLSPCSVTEYSAPITESAKSATTTTLTAAVESPRDCSDSVDDEPNETSEEIVEETVDTEEVVEDVEEVVEEVVEEEVVEEVEEEVVEEEVEVVEEEVVEEEVIEEEVEEEAEPEAEPEPEPEPEEEEGLCVMEVEIQGKTYYTTDDQNGTIHTITEDNDLGEEVGKYTNGVPALYKKQVRVIKKTTK